MSWKEEKHTGKLVNLENFISTKCIFGSEILIGDKITDGSNTWTVCSDEEGNNKHIPVYLRNENGSGHINPSIFRSIWLYSPRKVVETVFAYRYVVKPKWGSVGITDHYFSSNRDVFKSFERENLKVDQVSAIPFDYIKVKANKSALSYTKYDALSD